VFDGYRLAGPARNIRFGTRQEQDKNFSQRHRGTEKTKAQIFSVALERQDKPGGSCELKGVHHVNCLFNM